MERLFKELNRLEASGGFDDCIKSVDKLLAEVEAAKHTLQEGHSNPAAVLKTLSAAGQSTQASLTAAEKSLYSSITKYGKAVAKLMGSDSTPSPLPLLLPSGYQEQIQKALLMHLIRIGEFKSARSYMKETGLEKPEVAMTRFQTMYAILRDLQAGDIQLALRWTLNFREELEEKGSHLDFLLHKRQFLRLLIDEQNPLDAIQYATDHFHQYDGKYVDEIRHMMGAILFANQKEMDKSEYSDLFEFLHGDELYQLFKSEFCAMGDFSSESPLFLVTKAGSIALPVLVKIEKVMQNRGAEWTTKWELPVEIELPPSLQFHNIFVCPVSKEQTTDRNPPMMLKCCHIISLDTLSMLEGSHDGHAFKCPYCPQNCTYYESKRVCF